MTSETRVTTDFFGFRRQPFPAKPHPIYMSKRFVVGTRHEQALIPASLAEYLPPDHLARFIWQVVEKLDLRELLTAYGSDAGGRPAIDPKGLMALVLYGHAVGTASSRGL